MSTPDRSAGMQFIVSTDVKKTNPQTRKLIRSHVMRGKNRAKSRRPAEDVRAASNTMMIDPNHGPRLVPLDEVIESYYSFVPRKVGWDLSFSGLGDEIKPAMFGDMLQFFVISMRLMFPLGEFIGFDRNDKTWLELLTLDATCLHITAYAAGAFIDKILRNQHHLTHQETTMHFLKGVRLLREKLLRRDEDAAVSNATVSVVLTLANCAYGTGEYETAKGHLEGLRKIVKIRGGLATFTGSFGKKLLMEMLRGDIGLALHTGSKPMFFSDPNSEPLIPYPDQKQWVIGKITTTSGSENFLNEIDQDLGAAWRVMQRFCALVNLAIETQRMFSMEIVQDTMVSVMYRLLRMDFETGTVDEALRLGLLCFCYHIFLQWQGMRLPYPHFPSAYKNNLLKLKPVGGLSSKVVLWLLMVGGISIFDVSGDTWLADSLQEHIEMCDVKSWDELRDILKSLMWIGPLHDEPGKKIYDTVLTL